MDVVSLLESKNRCLRRFREVSADFLDAARSGDLTGLENFHLKRDAILRSLELYDRKINETISLIPTQEEKRKLAPRVQKALDTRDALVLSILQTDEEIIRKVEEEKARIQEELAVSRKSQQTIAKFKSTWVAESGEEIDRKL